MRSAAEIAPFAPSVAQLLWCIYQCCCWERPVYSITSIMCSQCCVGTQTGDPPPLRVHTALSPPSQTHGDRAHTLLPVSLTVPEHRLGLENQERGILFHFHGGMTWVLLPPSQSQLFFFFLRIQTGRKKESDILVSQEWLTARTRWRSRRNRSTMGTMWVWTRTWCGSWGRTCYNRSVLVSPGTADPCPLACLRSPCPRATLPGCFVACCLITTHTSSGASRWRTPGKGPDTVLSVMCFTVLAIHTLTCTLEKPLYSLRFSESRRLMH